jgi:hypothetical protein
MAIFTFMGEDFLRKDDRFTLDVIEQALGTLLRAVTASTESDDTVRYWFSLMLSMTRVVRFDRRRRSICSPCFAC